MIPFHFAIGGPPVSAQTKSRRRLQAWKQSVQLAAQAKIPAGENPMICDVAVRITYFYETAAPDVDNIIKPIQDALVGVVYQDDSQVTDTSSRKRKIDGAFRIRGVEPDLAVRLAYGDDFLWIEVTSPPDHQEIL